MSLHDRRIEFIREYPSGSRRKYDLQVVVDTDQADQQGWFELYDTDTGGENHHEEGGLWFNDRELVDYDGTPCIHEKVLEILDGWNFNTENMK